MSQAHHHAAEQGMTRLIFAYPALRHTSATAPCWLLTSPPARLAG